MKKLLALLLLFPFSTNALKAQDWEVGLNTAAVFSKTPGGLVLQDYYFLANHISIGVYHNIKRVQVGLKVDGGPRDRFDWWLAPQLVANYKITVGKLDVYGGGVFGYAKEHHRGYSMYGAHGESGFITGAHAGLVYYPGKRIGINFEPAVRFQRMYHTVNIINGGLASTERVGITHTYIPLSVGVRYRF